MKYISTLSYFSINFFIYYKKTIQSVYSTSIYWEHCMHRRTLCKHRLHCLHHKVGIPYWVIFTSSTSSPVISSLPSTSTNALWRVLDQTCLCVLAQLFSLFVWHTQSCLSIVTFFLNPTIFPTHAHGGPTRLQLWSGQQCYSNECVTTSALEAPFSCSLHRALVHSFAE